MKYLNRISVEVTMGESVGNENIINFLKYMIFVNIINIIYISIPVPIPSSMKQMRRFHIM